jgi:IS30 family transposase
MMTKNYGRLTFDERIEIEKLLSHKKTYGDIARTLNRSKSTISREVKKQSCTAYKAMQGEALAVGSVKTKSNNIFRWKNTCWKNFPFAGHPVKSV